MRDGINLARRGLPVIVFVHDGFSRAARIQAKTSGWPKLRIYVYPQYVPGHISPDIEQQKAVKAVEELPGLLLDYLNH